MDLAWRRKPRAGTELTGKKSATAPESWRDRSTSAISVLCTSSLTTHGRVPPINRFRARSLLGTPQRWRQSIQFPLSTPGQNFESLAGALRPSRRGYRVPSQEEGTQRALRSYRSRRLCRPTTSRIGLYVCTRAAVFIWYSTVLVRRYPSVRKFKDEVASCRWFPQTLRQS